MRLLALTFGGKCCWRSIAVARVFALVVTCWISLFVTNFSGYAKTVTPKWERPRQRASLCRHYKLSCGREVFAAQKPIAFTALLATVHLLY